MWGAVWNPYVRPDQKGDADRPEWSEFVTYGVKHVALWRCYKDKATKCVRMRSYYPAPHVMCEARAARGRRVA